MNRRMKKKVQKLEEKRQLEAVKVVEKVPVVKPVAKEKPAKKEKPILPKEENKTVKADGEVQLLISKKIHLFVSEKGKAACGSAQGEGMEIRVGKAEEVTCKLCQRSL